MRDVIKFCEPNGLILDPFAGSGSTLHAGALDGYRVVGIEKTDDYYNIAKERLKNVIADNTCAMAPDVAQDNKKSGSDCGSCV